MGGDGRANPLDVTDQMNRDTSEFCNHALTEFSFLGGFGFSQSHMIGVPNFSIEFTRPDSRTVEVGAFLPRYEYYVSLRHSNNQYGLDELATVIEPDSKAEFDWTWAHSDPETFKIRISYSATLLHRLIGCFLDDANDLWDRISSRRRAFADSERDRDQRKLAESAFTDGQWQNAIDIYGGLDVLSPLEAKRLSIAKRRVE